MQFSARPDWRVSIVEYVAKIKKEDGAYVVSFPDFPNVNTYGETRAEAVAYAHEALNGALEIDFERGFSLPSPSKLSGRNTVAVRVQPNIAIAYQLRRLRRDQTQAEIAKRIGISYQAYQKLENPRKCNPTVKTLERVSSALGTTLDVVFY